MMKRMSRVVALSFSVVALAAAGTLATVQPTQATFTDSISTGTTGTLAAHTMTSHRQPGCEQTGFLTFKNVEITWPQVDARYSYRVETTRPDGTVGTATVGAGIPTGGEVLIELNSAIARDQTGTYTLRITAQIGTNWRAPTTTTTRVTRTLVIGWDCV